MERDSLLDSEFQNEDQSVNGIDDNRAITVWLTIRGCLNSVAHMLIGANVFVALWFAFKSTPISAFQLHVGLCVIGVSVNFFLNKS